MKFDSQHYTSGHARHFLKHRNLSVFIKEALTQEQGPILLGAVYPQQETSSDRAEAEREVTWLWSQRQSVAEAGTHQQSLRGPAYEN